MASFWFEKDKEASTDMVRSNATGASLEVRVTDFGSPCYPIKYGDKKFLECASHQPSPFFFLKKNSYLTERAFALHPRSHSAARPGGTLSGIVGKGPNHKNDSPKSHFTTNT